jgi:hypothetical protein
MSLRLSELQFGSFLSYSPNGSSPDDVHSQGVMTLLKADGFLGSPPILMSQWVARQVRQNLNSLPFASLFQRTSVLVPVPSSSLMRAGTLWVPQRIATALASEGLGGQTVSCLVRTQAVPKAAFSPSRDRPTARRHYETLAVQGRLSEPETILMVDDIITRGATLLGAANRLAEAFPHARISAFAAMRTVSNPDEFQKEYDPRMGVVRLREDGSTLRRP